MDVNCASRLFREISREEISALFQAALGEGEIRTSRLLQGGLFNTTYYVEYGPEPRQAVLRLGPVNRHLLMGHERDLMAAEVRMGALCREAGVPCSHVLAWDDSRQSFGRDYMIAAYIPSVVMAEAPLPNVRAVLDYAVTEIPAGKIFLGIPNYGYDWPLPFVRGATRAQSISNQRAIELALEHEIAIQFDETAQAPFFHYTDNGGTVHEVWFEDARSMDAKLRLIAEYGFQGGGVWNLMRPFSQIWQVMAALYDIW